MPRTPHTTHFAGIVQRRPLIVRGLRIDRDIRAQLEERPGHHSVAVRACLWWGGVAQELVDLCT